MPSEISHPSPADPDYDPLADLLDVLNLVRVDPGEAPPTVPTDPGSTGPAFEEFEGRSQPQLHGRVFGGQVVAQSVVAAGRTVSDVEGEGTARRIHSLHGYFLRPGDATSSIRFVVERLRDGRSFSARRVHAMQHGRPILSMIFSFQSPDEGLDHADTMPQVPGPETLPDAARLLADFRDQPAHAWATRRAIDIRHVDRSLYVGPPPERVAHQNVWIKAVGRLPDDPLLHSAVLAYASDYTLLESVLRRHGIAWTDPRLRIASLDHSMWFHRAPRADDWMLYAQASPSAGSGRGLSLGRIFSRDGTLVATVGQEGMVRLKESRR